MALWEEPEPLGKRTEGAKLKRLLMGLCSESR
jgi:hypothetical protein